MPEIDAEEGRRAAASELRGAQDRAVAAEHDHELELTDGDIAAEHPQVVDLRGSPQLVH